MKNNIVALVVILFTLSCNLPSGNSGQEEGNQNEQHITTIQEGTDIDKPFEEESEIIIEEFDEEEVKILEYKREEIKDKLFRTEIVPILGVNIKPKTNYVYCSTIQLAWDKIKEKNPSFIENNQSLNNYVTYLNENTYLGSVNEHDYVAVFGNKHEAEGEIEKQMMTKFNLSIDKLKLPDGNSFLAFAYLQKELKFKYSFSKDKLKFKNKVVKSFSTDNPDVIRQVFLRYCAFSEKNDFRKNDFVIELFTGNKEEQIILAKVKPQKTLEETYNRISKLVSQKQIVDTFYSELLKTESTVRFPFLLSEKEFVNIPVLSFDIEKSYDELNGAVLDDGRKIEQNKQKINFCLNESGMILKSVVEIADSIGAFKIPPILFNEPFLLIAKERKAKQPYLVIWVDNSGILLPE